MGEKKTYNELVPFGWDAFFEEAFLSLAIPEAVPGRVMEELKHWYRVQTPDIELLCRVRGTAVQQAESRQSLPAVGDWVAVGRLHEEDRGIIHEILPRHSCLMRQAITNRLEEQVIAANVDVVLIVQGLDDDFNPRRLERYLALAWESGAQPAVILNKIDICPDVIAAETCARSVVRADVPLIMLSALEGKNMELLKSLIKPGKTFCLVGASGSGKSTLVNTLLGDAVQKVRDVREKDSRGRHTTTTRQIFFIPGSGLLMDTPGLRELQLFGLERGLGQVFSDVEEYAKGCRFRDCFHENEPGCTVLEAVADGRLDKKRLANYRKLQKELAGTEQKHREQKQRPGRRRK